jgi:hypothetical protein
MATWAFLSQERLQKSKIIDRLGSGSRALRGVLFS